MQHTSYRLNQRLYRKKTCKNMKKKEFGELKDKKGAELAKLLAAKKLEITQITSKIYAGREKNLKRAKNLRRDVAQIMTVLVENMKKEVNEGKKEGGK